jgi:hypothetical protein
MTHEKINKSKMRRKRSGINTRKKTNVLSPQRLFYSENIHNKNLSSF